MKNRLIQNKHTITRKMGRRFLAALLICSMLVSLIGCSKKSMGTSTPNGDVDANPLTVEHELSPPELKAANSAAALAVRQYLYARLKTEAFITGDLKTMETSELANMVNELEELWETSQILTSGAEEIADKALITLAASDSPFIASTGKADTQFIPLNSDSNNYEPVSLIANKADYQAVRLSSGTDAKKWAENFTAEYDSMKGGQAIKQLAKQLGMDAKAVHEQLVLAQEIIQNDALSDADYYDKLLKIAQGTKSACKVGLFVAGTVASGGGSLAALGASSVTLAQAGAVIVGGADCIVDVATTGSTIFLGENHQVTLGFEDVKNNLAPVSAVIGLLNFNPAETGDQLAYIGDTLTDWFYDGKILGVKVDSGTKGTKISVQSADVEKNNEEKSTQAIKDLGFTAPVNQPATEGATAVIEANSGKLEISKEEALALLESLIKQIDTIAKTAKQVENSAPGATSQDLTSLGTDTLSGTYTGKMTITKVEVVYDSDDVDEDGNVTHVYRPDGNDASEGWVGTSVDLTLDFVQEENTVLILNAEGETSFVLAYDTALDKWISSKANIFGTNSIEGIFSNSGGTINVKIIITETFELSEVPDGINETVIELTRSN